MLQIVHDVAPAANLVFSNDANATGIRSEGAFAANITSLWQTEGADVIVDDLIYFAEPMFEEGPVAQAAREAVENGVVYVSAAGNFADASYESTFNDSQQNVQITIGQNQWTVRAHDFNPGGGVDILQRITIPALQTTAFSFQWDEPFGAATTNFEFFAIDGNTGNPIAKGTQLNALNPVEILGLTNPTGAAYPIDILIGVNGALPAGVTNMKYVAFNDQTQIIDFPTNSPTAFGHVLAEGVIGVGAANYWQTPEFGATPPILATYSALGGVDIVAPDGGNTTFLAPMLSRMPTRCRTFAARLPPRLTLPVWRPCSCRQIPR